jgi:hypothetical protein
MQDDEYNRPPERWQAIANVLLAILGIIGGIILIAAGSMIIDLIRKAGVSIEQGATGFAYIGLGIFVWALVGLLAQRKNKH